jgi:peptide/nickel transport system ATP-binding protein
MKDLIKVNHLCVDYITLSGRVRAVDDVSFSIKKDSIFGLAGESGCGKSTIAHALMRLHRPPALISEGEILFEGKDVIKFDDEELRSFRWKDASMVFQSAMNCLNPVKTIEFQFLDIFKAHGIVKTRKESLIKAQKLLKVVDIAPERLFDYPHQFSGGMRQRVVIAMALALKPKLLIMDEPTTALDVVVQREILQKVYELKGVLGFSVLFITHDLSLMVEFCDQIGIMYSGKLVEVANAKTILKEPKHPYTYGLGSSFPTLKGKMRVMAGIPGSPVNLSELPKGCRFAERCFQVSDNCMEKEPLLETTDSGQVACYNKLNITELATLNQKMLENSHGA